MALSRRRFLQSSLALTAVSAVPRIVLAADPALGIDYQLVMEAAEVNIVPGGPTPAWCFNGGFPAPVIRARQHQPIRIRVVNRLDEPTTVHWHGLRVPIEMDGVPFLSHPPIQPGAHFDYEFLNQETQKLLITPQMTSDGKSTNYGMGYSTLRQAGNNWVGHSGGSVGGSTMFLMNKEHRIVIAYTINRSGASFDDLHFKIGELFITK